MPDREPAKPAPDSSDKVNATVMFADIARSTSLYTRLGDRAAASLVERILDVLASTVRSNGGLPLRTKGDELLSTFAEAENAVSAAMAIHSAVQALSTPESGSLQMRIGMNSGPALLVQGDILGDTVNMAARLVAFAKAGQTILSKEVLDGLKGPGIGHVRALGEFALKGKSDPISLFELHDAAALDEITQTGPARAFVLEPRRLHLRFQAGKVTLDASLDRYLMGRAPDCQLRFDHPLVSRHHGEIRFENNQFLLVDFSTNGTLLITGGEPHLLHHSQGLLQGRGTIFLGRTGFDRSFEINFHTDDDR